MLDTEVKAILESKAANWTFQVTGADRNFQIEAVSDEFASMSGVKRQQAVYRLIADEIADGRLHAITITALTPEEKASRQGMGI